MSLGIADYSRHRQGEEPSPMEAAADESEVLSRSLLPPRPTYATQPPTPEKGNYRMKRKKPAAVAITVWNENSAMRLGKKVCHCASS